jgi:hypothetical protein
VYRTNYIPQQWYKYYVTGLAQVTTLIGGLHVGLVGAHDNTDDHRTREQQVTVIVSICGLLCFPALDLEVHAAAMEAVALLTRERDVAQRISMEGRLETAYEMVREKLPCLPKQLLVKVRSLLHFYFTFARTRFEHLSWWYVG